MSSTSLWYGLNAVCSLTKIKREVWYSVCINFAVNDGFNNFQVLVEKCGIDMNLKF